MPVQWLLDAPDCKKWYELPNMRMLEVAIEWNRQDNGLPPRMKVSRKEKDEFLHILDHQCIKRENKAPPYSTSTASEEFCKGGWDYS